MISHILRSLVTSIFIVVSDPCRFARGKCQNLRINTLFNIRFAFHCFRTNVVKAFSYTTTQLMFSFFQEFSTFFWFCFVSFLLFKTCLVSYIHSVVLIMSIFFFQFSIDSFSWKSYSIWKCKQNIPKTENITVLITYYLTEELNKFLW